MGERSTLNSNNFAKQMKIETYELTDKEATLAQCADIKFEYFYEETGYSNCDGDSSFLCFTLREALKTTDFDKHQIAGIIGSLEKKGVLYIEHRDPVLSLIHI